jgi:hypothetical protein
MFVGREQRVPGTLLSPVNAGSTDILSNGSKKDEIVFRGQLQLWI